MNGDSMDSVRYEAGRTLGPKRRISERQIMSLKRAARTDTYTVA
jgi:hypothetical protein